MQKSVFWTSRQEATKTSQPLRIGFFVLILICSLHDFCSGLSLMLFKNLVYFGLDFENECNDFFCLFFFLLYCSFYYYSTYLLQFH